MTWNKNLIEDVTVCECKPPTLFSYHAVGLQFIHLELTPVGASWQSCGQVEDFEWDLIGKKQHAHSVHQQS